MSRASVLARGRRAAEAGMTDSCTITAPGVGEPTIDEDTGQRTYPLESTVYSGKCRLQVPTQITGSSQENVAGGDWTTQGVVVMLPVSGSEAVRPGHLVTIDTAAYDDALVGRKLTVTALHHKSHATSRRLRCEEVTGG